MGISPKDILQWRKCVLANELDMGFVSFIGNLLVA